MSWQVIQYLDENPQAPTKEIISYLAKTLEIDDQIESVKKEVANVRLLREQLRPLYGKKMEAERKLTILNSDFEADVMYKYPKGKGSQKDRKDYKNQLQTDSEDYQENLREIEDLKDEIEDLEDQMFEVQERAKNGRKLLTTFNEGVSFILQYKSDSQKDERESNHAIF